MPLPYPGPLQALLWEEANDFACQCKDQGYRKHTMVVSERPMCSKPWSTQPLLLLILPKWQQLWSEFCHWYECAGVINQPLLCRSPELCDSYSCPRCPIGTKIFCPCSRPETQTCPIATLGDSTMQLPGWTHPLCHCSKSHHISTQNARDICMRGYLHLYISSSVSDSVSAGWLPLVHWPAVLQHRAQ